MIKAVLHMNVLASGVLGFASVERTPTRLLRLWQAQRFELIVSDHILAKLINTMGKAYFQQRLTVDQIRATQRLLQDGATQIPLSTYVSGVAPHPEDDLVLAAAVTADADYLVTGDKRFLAVGSYAGVTILSPRTFLDLLESTGDQ